MKNKIIFLLLWVLIGFGLWIYEQYKYKEKLEIEWKQIEQNIKKINKNKNNEVIKIKKEKYIKEEILRNFLDNKNEKKEEVIEVEIISFWKFYEKMYNIITKNKRVIDSYWTIDFQNTFLYKRINELKWNTIHTIVKNNIDNTITHYDNIPIDIKCPSNIFCKKKIDYELNNIYKSNNNILKIKEFDIPNLKNDEIIKILQSWKTFYEYFYN